MVTDSHARIFFAISGNPSFFTNGRMASFTGASFGGNFKTTRLSFFSGCAQIFFVISFAQNHQNSSVKAN